MSCLRLKVVKYHAAHRRCPGQSSRHVVSVVFTIYSPLCPSVPLSPVSIRHALVFLDITSLVRHNRVVRSGPQYEVVVTGRPFRLLTRKIRSPSWSPPTLALPSSLCQSRSKSSRPIVAPTWAVRPRTPSPVPLEVEMETVEELDKLASSWSSTAPPNGMIGWRPCYAQLI